MERLRACYECYAHDYGYGFTSRMTVCFGSDESGCAQQPSNKIMMRLYDELNGNAKDGGTFILLGTFLGRYLPGK